MESSAAFQDSWLCYSFLWGVALVQTLTEVYQVRPSVSNPEGERLRLGMWSGLFTAVRDGERGKERRLSRGHHVYLLYPYKAQPSDSFSLLEGTEIQQL